MLGFSFAPVGPVNLIVGVGAVARPAGKSGSRGATVLTPTIDTFRQAGPALDRRPRS